MDAKLRNTILLALDDCDARSTGNMRDLALLFCGAKPAVYALVSDPISAELIEAASGAGFALERWHDSVFGPPAVVAGEPARAREIARLCRNLAANGPAEQERLGLLLGYPAASAYWYAYRRHEGLGSPRAWSDDERRFIMCAYPRDPAGLAQARAWTQRLLERFILAYGLEAMRRLPYVAYPEPEPTLHPDGRIRSIPARSSLVYQG